jgi:hypothetical protein
MLSLKRSGLTVPDGLLIEETAGCMVEQRSPCAAAHELKAATAACSKRKNSHGNRNSHRSENT